MVQKDKKKIISSDSRDGNDTDYNLKSKSSKNVNAIKTGDDKKQSTHDQPADEQMFDSFDDIRKEKGLKKD